MSWFSRRRLARWFVRGNPVVRRMVPRGSRERVAVDHVIILDGTNSNLVQGDETNAGMLYKLLREQAPASDLNLHYEGGIAWDGWRSTVAVITGKGINGQIKRAYGAISSRYHPGDRIFLFGFSRGAYAVRSLAGIIGMVGLLKGEHATERNIRQLFRHYEFAPDSAASQAFSDAYCQRDVTIEVVGVWDTVKSLGFRAPGFMRRAEKRYRFHNHRLGPEVRHGFHALALDENRQAFAPILWTSPEGYSGRLEQVWFRGAHGDIGGQLGGVNRVRPFSNIPLVWLLKRAESCGLRLPQGWHRRFETDPYGPQLGNLRGLNRAFVFRKKRVVGMDASEMIHESVVAIEAAGGKPAPDLPVAEA